MKIKSFLKQCKKNMMTSLFSFCDPETLDNFFNSATSQPSSRAALSESIHNSRFDTYFPKKACPAMKVNIFLFQQSACFRLKQAYYTLTQLGLVHQWMAGQFFSAGKFCTLMKYPPDLRF